jgi:hypothetical protein
MLVTLVTAAEATVRWRHESAETAAAAGWRGCAMIKPGVGAGVVRRTPLWLGGGPALVVALRVRCMVGVWYGLQLGAYRVIGP